MNAKVEPEANVVPVDRKRYVHIGTKAVENLVTALSIFLPVITSPANNSEVVALFQLRDAFGAELRTTESILPTLEILTITPSTFPANFLPPSVSELEPIAVIDPSLFLTTDSKLVASVPV